MSGMFLKSSLSRCQQLPIWTEGKGNGGARQWRHIVAVGRCTMPQELLFKPLLQGVVRRCCALAASWSATPNHSPLPQELQGIERTFPGPALHQA